jgi:hypothetical protein
MHASLYCGALSAYLFVAAGGTRERAYCSAACCEQQPETLSHLFLDCPCVRPAVDWLLDTWHAISGVRPPLDARVLLADDHRVWEPGGALGELWTLMRLTLLHAAWSLRCKRQATGSPVQPAGVAAMTVASLRRHVLLDWLRCIRDVRVLTLACCSWFHGKDPALEREEFEKRWGPPGVLCVVSGVGVGALDLSVRLTTSHPVPVPAVDPALSLPATLDD